MILVTGATGHVGSESVRLLAEQGAPARALVHEPDKAASIQRLGLEVAVGDFEQPGTLDAAMAGCDPPVPGVAAKSPPARAGTQRVIDAAKRAGVAHVVKQTVLGADPEASMAFGRWHGQIEQYLDQSGLAYTLVRPHSFMQNFLLSAQPVAEQGVLYGMTGEGRTSYSDTRDIAAVAAQVLTSPGHQGQRYTVTGPEALSAAEVAERLSAAIGPCSAASRPSCWRRGRCWPELAPPTLVGDAVGGIIAGLVPAGVAWAATAAELARAAARAARAGDRPASRPGAPSGRPARRRRAIPGAW